LSAIVPIRIKVKQGVAARKDQVGENGLAEEEQDKASEGDK
jgi:hypothetical protein